MPRIAVIGSGGAGKSTFAEELGRRLGLPVVHLDRLFWRPGWHPTPPDEWRAIQRGLVDRPDWIIDGNYGATFHLRLEAADVVVFFDLPRRVAISGVIRRWRRHRGRDVQAAGCAERLRLDFLRWVWRYPRDSRPRVQAALRAHAVSAEVIEVRSRREVLELLSDSRLESFRLRRAGSGRSTGPSDRSRGEARTPSSRA